MVKDERTNLETNEILGFRQCSCDLPEQAAGLSPAGFGRRLERISFQVGATIWEDNDSIHLGDSESIYKAMVSIVQTMNIVLV